MKKCLYVDVKSETINNLRGISKDIDTLIDVCQSEWEGSTSRIGSFKIYLDDDDMLNISFIPRFSFTNSTQLEKIKEIINKEC